MTIIDSNHRMEVMYADLAKMILDASPFDRGGVHAQATKNFDGVTKEILHNTLQFEVDAEQSAWVETIKPNLPWAEDHFQERVSGQPLNPPPSHNWWPFNQAGNEEHLVNEVFSHTYPERFWPKQAGLGNWSCTEMGYDMHGVRFDYGDLDDVVGMLRKNPLTRQAYLTVWFPEDAAAGVEGQRVPCSLGYHFLYNPRTNKLDMTYYLRSCDLVRFFRDDMYMAGRLLQWVTERTPRVDQATRLQPGKMVVHIANLHAFVGDRMFLTNAWKSAPGHARAHYNFDALG